VPAHRHARFAALPALLTKGSRDQFLFVYMRYQQRLVSQEGAPQLPIGPARGGLPTASISLSSGQTHLRAERRHGPALRTQLASQEPSSSPIGHDGKPLRQRGLLTTIGRCYGRRGRPVPGLPRPGLHLHHAAALDGLDEGQDDIDLRGPQASRVSYVLYGSCPGTGQLSQTAITYIFGKLGITSQVYLVRKCSPTGRVPGRGVLGVHAQWQAWPSTAGLCGTDTSTSGLRAMRLATAPTALWSSLNGGMIQMMGAIQHNFTQDLQSLQR